jgi:CBS domain-containing protein
MRVHNIMIKNPITVQPDTPVREVARLMRDKGISSVIITDENKPVGIITERDLVRRILATGLNPENLTSEQIASKPVVAVNQVMAVDDAVDIMRDKEIRRLVIVDEEDYVVGILTSDDIGYNLRRMSETLAVKYITSMRR